MRVALVNRLAGIHRGGGEVYDLCLAAALKSAGQDVELITGRPLLAPGSPLSGDVPVTYVRTPYLRGWAHRLGRAGWRIFDQDLRWFEAAAARILAARRPRPEIVQVTGLPDLAGRLQDEIGLEVVLLFPGPPSVRHRDAIRRARHVVGVGAVTAYLKENFRQDVGDMSAGVDISMFRPGARDLRSRLGLPDSAPVVLFAGRLVPLKNLPFLVEAFAGVREMLPEARFIVAGDGPLRGDLLRAARKAGLSVATEGAGGAAVVHVSEVPHAGMPAFYAAADLLLLSSLNESFSLVALEAMACGVPVVAPRVGYLPRLVDDGSSGSLYPPGDKTACVARCAELLRDPEARRVMGIAGREIALARYSWKSVAEEFLSLYRGILSS